MSEGKGVFIPEGHQPKVETKAEIAYVGILNKVLPPEIRVIAWAPVSESISARFDCQKRTYHYYFPRATLNIEVNLNQVRPLLYSYFIFLTYSENEKCFTTFDRRT